ncbi:MAG: hypothetical protein ACXVWU_05930 [Nocardioides sp.]
MTRSPHVHRLAALCLVAAAVLTGCSSTSTSGGSSPSAGASSKPAVCADVEHLKKSVQGLKNTTISQGALAKVTSDVATIKQQFTTLKGDAKGQYAAEVSQVSSALDGLSANVDAAKASTTAATLSAVATSLRRVGTSVQALGAAVSSTC